MRRSSLAEAQSTSVETPSAKIATDSSTKRTSRERLHVVSTDFPPLCPAKLGKDNYVVIRTFLQSDFLQELIQRAVAVQFDHVQGLTYLRFPKGVTTDGEDYVFPDGYRCSLQMVVFP